MSFSQYLKKFKLLNHGNLQKSEYGNRACVDAIGFTNLSKSFAGIKAVNDLTIGFPKGLVTGLIGPNGSGKSTLVNLLTGLLMPDNGTITVNKRAFPYVKPYKLRKYKIARTFQDSRLVEQLSVKDNLLLPVGKNKLFKSLFEQNADAYQSRLSQVVAMTDLQNHLEKKAEDLSYGLRKLLEIGRVLMQDADIYFFDEPFTGLFPEMVEHVSEIILHLKSIGKTVILIEHNMALIDRLTDYVIVLDHGTLLAQGAPKDVLKNKQVQEAYLGV